MKKLYLYRWLSIINHKNIGVLYLLFRFIAGIIGTLFNIIIRVEFKEMLKLRKNWELYIIILNLIMVFFYALYLNVSYNK
jgi:heme/copper-type cytochrome/quinol oxidase subunit 1